MSSHRTLGTVQAVADLGPGDQEALVTFECSTGERFEDEIEHWIRKIAHGEYSSGNTRLILFYVEEELVAVAGTQKFGERIHLRAAAVSVGCRSAHIGDGRRLSDVVLAATVADAAGNQPGISVVATVHHANVRSLSVLERNGLTTRVESPAGRDYVDLIGTTRD